MNLELIAETLFGKKCRHEHMSLDKDFGYCPDCGCPLNIDNDEYVIERTIKPDDFNVTKNGVKQDDIININRDVLSSLKYKFKKYYMINGDEYIRGKYVF